MADKIQIRVTDEGLEIQLLEDSLGVFFESGNAVPSMRGRQILALLGHELSGLPNPVLVAGYTDSRAVPPRRRLLELGAFRGPREHDAAHPHASTACRTGGSPRSAASRDHELKDAEHPFAAGNRRVDDHDDVHARRFPWAPRRPIRSPRPPIRGGLGERPGHPPARGSRREVDPDVSRDARGRAARAAGGGARAATRRCGWLARSGRTSWCSRTTCSGMNVFSFCQTLRQDPAFESTMLVLEIETRRERHALRGAHVRRGRVPDAAGRARRDPDEGADDAPPAQGLRGSAAPTRPSSSNCTRACVPASTSCCSSWHA